MRFNEKVQEACGRRGWGAMQLRAALPGKKKPAKQTIYNWWEGATTPDLKWALRIAKLLNLDLDYMADDEQEEPPAPALSADEQFILTMIRDLKMGRAEVVNRLYPKGRAIDDADRYLPTPPGVDIDPATNQPVAPPSRKRPRDGRNGT